MRFARNAAVWACAIAMMSGPAIAADIYEGDRGSLKDPVYAGPGSTYYFALRGGAAFTDDTDFDTDLGNVVNEYDEPGYFVSGAVGMSMASLTGIGGLRGELELGYLESEIDTHTVDGGLFPSNDSFGETSAFFGLVNLFYDFNQFGAIKPFIGGGIGFASVDFDGHGVTGPGVVMDDDDTGFAYQLSAGANIAISASTDIELGYRYMGVTDVELTSTTAGGNVTSDVDVDNHIIYGGLRFKM